VYIAFVSPLAMSLDWGWVVPVFFHSVKDSRLVFPGGACLVEVAPPIGNNLLRPALHLAGACSSAGGGLARFEPVGAGDLVGAPEFVSGCTGALIRLMAASAEEMMTAWCSVCRGGGFRDVVVRYVDLVLFWRAQFQDQGGAGCVPGRCSSTEIWFLPVVVGVCCGSCQSHGAMALLLIQGELPSLVASCACGGVRRRKTLLEDAEPSKDCFANSLFHRDLCVVWWGMLFLLYPLRTRWYMYVYLYVFLAS